MHGVKVEGGKRRPAVLILIAYYLPGYKSGGPLHAIAGLVDALGDEFEFKIITSDRDLGEKRPYPGVQPGCWTRLGKALVLYVNSSNPLSVTWHVAKTPHDILYTKSFFSVPFSLWPIWMHLLGILRKPIVVAPCGEFAHAALTLKKHRKRIYLKIAGWLDVYVHTIWHATSEYEAQDIKREFGSKTRTITARSIGFIGEAQPENRLRIAVASELASTLQVRRDDAVRPAKVRGELRAVFLARVARVKNLGGAIQYLFDLHGQVVFDIYGPLEDERYWAECQELMAKLPGNIQVNYLGPVPHQAVDLIFHDYHLLLLPTLGENFGYSILEALLAGLPILISDQTPWRQLQGDGVGWDLPLNEPERVREVLQRCVDMGPEEHGAMVARARAYGLKHSQDTNVVAHNRAMFQSALG